ncbi:hypothetical protein RMN57_01360 [Kitasatospora sp. CM 4170]|uniref:Uncharacterized protein n=1 Tax=Kitasatospora aburaviensis TaxID=67265 RepID=A0ABW1FAI9_9ACTN|nr:hypothetical protein [Kitasatospora sp. CM 4170]WNM43446.1 hypothetical protein RMN57_01360 [Kitasatospora sp. CM 4170]
MSGSPKNSEDVGPREDITPMASVLSGVADENAAIRALGARSGASAVAALDGFATGDALTAALVRWQHRTEALEQALGDASTALGGSRPDPSA